METSNTIHMLILIETYFSLVHKRTYTHNLFPWENHENGDLTKSVRMLLRSLCEKVKIFNCDLRYVRLKWRYMTFCVRQTPNIFRRQRIAKPNSFNFWISYLFISIYNCKTGDRFRKSHVINVSRIRGRYSDVTQQRVINGFNNIYFCFSDGIERRRTWRSYWYTRSIRRPRQIEFVERRYGQ